MSLLVYMLCLLVTPRHSLSFPLEVSHESGEPSRQTPSCGNKRLCPDPSQKGWDGVGVPVWVTLRSNENFSDKIPVILGCHRDLLHSPGYLNVNPTFPFLWNLVGLAPETVESNGCTGFHSYWLFTLTPEIVSVPPSTFSVHTSSPAEC